MRVLITGVGGFLGSRLAEWIVRNVSGAAVFGLDDFSCGYPQQIPAGVHYWHRKLGSSYCFDCRPHAPFDVVFHFAAAAYEGLSPWIRVQQYHDNLLSTAEVLNHCLRFGVGRLVFASSMAVYGPGDPPFDEKDRPNPVDPYGVAKSAAERDIWIAGWQHQLDWCIIRPHNIYGPGQSLWQRYRNVLGLWMRQYLEGKPITVFGDGMQRRAFSFIDDMLPAIWNAATRHRAQREIINLGGSQPMTILAAAQAFRDLVPDVRIEHLPPRTEVHDAWCTVSKSTHLLDYDEKTRFLDGLAAMWTWAQEVWQKYPERRDMGRIRVEHDKELHPAWQSCVTLPADI